MPRLGSDSPLLDVSGSTGGRGGAMVATMAPIFLFILIPCCLLVCRVSLLLCGFRRNEALVDLIATWTAEFFGLREGEEECPRRSEEAGDAAAHRAAMVTSLFARDLTSFFFFSLRIIFQIPNAQCTSVYMYVCVREFLFDECYKIFPNFQSNPLLDYSQSPIPRTHHWISTGSKIQEEKPACVTVTLLPAHRTVSTILLACLLASEQQYWDSPYTAPLLLMMTNRKLTDGPKQACLYILTRPKPRNFLSQHGSLRGYATTTSTGAILLLLPPIPG